LAREQCRRDSPAASRRRWSSAATSRWSGWRREVGVVDDWHGLHGDGRQGDAAGRVDRQAAVVLLGDVAQPQPERDQADMAGAAPRLRERTKPPAWVLRGDLRGRGDIGVVLGEPCEELSTDRR